VHAVHGSWPKGYADIYNTCYIVAVAVAVAVVVLSFIFSPALTATNLETGFVPAIHQSIFI